MVRERRRRQRLLARERRLVRETGFLASHAAVVAAGSAVMFLVVLAVTRDLVVATVAGSPFAVALCLALWALAARLWLAAVRRRLAAHEEARQGGDPDRLTAGAQVVELLAEDA
jgi:hypothetical protein